MTAVVVPRSAVPVTSAGVVIGLLVLSALTLLVSLPVPGSGVVAPAASEAHAYDHGQYGYDERRVHAADAASASIVGYDDTRHPVADVRGGHLVALFAFVAALASVCAPAGVNDAIPPRDLQLRRRRSQLHRRATEYLAVATGGRSGTPDRGGSGVTSRLVPRVPCRKSGN